MSQVEFLGSPVPVFPWPEGPQDLLDSTVGIPGLWAAAPSNPALRILAAPHAVWTAAVVAALEKAAGTRLPARLAVVCSPMTEMLAPLQGAALSPDGKARVYDVFLVAQDGRAWTVSELQAQATPVVLDLPSPTHSVRTPGYGPPPHHQEIPQTAAWAGHVHHWAHLLWLLQGAPALLLGRHKGNRLGKGVKIHATAHVENSVLMDGVELDAHATVSNSVLGAGVRVADHSSVDRSVLGPGCITLGDTMLRRVVAMPGSTLSNLDLVECILGRQVFITAGVIFFRGSPGATVKVGQNPSSLQETGRAELGGAVGHNCVLGTRAIFEPGRAVPQGTVIVMRPEEGVTHIPAGLPPGTPVAWDAGGLVPVAKRWPGHTPPEMDGE